MENRPIIALVGRPNVGKSTIFNRLIGRREAITSHIPGTTRDRHFGVMQWFQNSWTIIDTAGLLLGPEESELENKDLHHAMEEQAEVAIEEANLVAIVVDVKEGLTHDDRRLIELFRKHDKSIVLLANKADNQAFRLQAETFRQLGIETIFPISAVHGTGVGDFIDYLIEHFPAEDAHDKEEIPRVTFIGRPNVGKSTLVNRILGEKRMVVSAVPGTTRDSIEVDAQIDNNTPFKLVDTAGIRRRGKIEEGIEKFSLFRTLRAINWSNIVVVLLTIEEAPTRGDAHVVMYAQEANKEVILLLNKADLAIDNVFRLPANKKAALAGKFLKRFPFMQKLPFYFVSGQTGEGVNEFLNGLKEKIKTSSSS